jgi:leucyl/phenylalanyl-tRNA---protein transferase
MAISAELTPELVLRAYCSGIFPMGDEDGTINWYAPDPRCVIDLDDFHAGKRLMRTYRQRRYEIRVDTAFSEVIAACANRQAVWITPPIIEVYTQLQQLNFAHSVEAFAEGKLVGGLYGVSIGGAFMGESMFSTQSDASKVCLVFLIERLKQKGYSLLDCQYMNEHLRQFGAKLIPRSDYLHRLEQALSQSCNFC